MAAGQAIASGSVILTANADQMANGLTDAGRKVEGWGKGLSSRLGTMFKGGLAIGAGMQVFDAIASFPGKVLDKFKHMKEELDHASKSARAFGADMATWQGIVHAADLAGVGVEELEAGLARFRRQVDGPIDEALYGLAKRLEGIRDPGERAQILVENFGKSGLKLAGLFEEGEEGLKGLVAEAEKLGFALSEADGKAIEEANDAVRRTHKAVDGLWNRLVVALAPAFTEVANILTGWIVKGQPVFDWLSRAFTQTFEIAQAVWGAVVEHVEAVWAVIKGMAGSLFDFAAGMPTVQEVIVGMFRAVGTAAAYVWDTIKAGMGIVTYVASGIVSAFGYVVEAFKEVIKLAEKLPERFKPAGLGEFIAGVDRFEKRVKDSGKAMREWAWQAATSFGQSAINFNAWLDAALTKKKQLEKGPRLEGDFGPQVFEPFKLAAAIQKDSKEAYSVSVRNKFGDMVPQKDKVEDVLKQNGKKQDKGNDHLKAIEKRLAALEEI